ncbi:hypothetical protein CEXT_458851 [Caerostris extrusa]|uniref:Uncharacterized protein n=1 Tax=Caerostris extrusa TaxID=172846 RepID=A0AAV4XZE8_CAEEX|nr:hypothetical protein CEXT_458851 [Caerostris extrusa]
MRLSPSGAVLTIAELRKEQEGVLACSVFTNMNVFSTKRRFYIKELNETNNQLLLFPQRPSLRKVNKLPTSAPVTSTTYQTTGDEWEESEIKKREPKALKQPYDTHDLMGTREPLESYESLHSLPHDPYAGGTRHGRSIDSHFKKRTGEQTFKKHISY